MNETYHILVKRKQPELLSIVVPVFNEEEVLPLFLKQMKILLDQFPCPTEVILVNDGSSDRTILILRDASETDSRLKAINLARNFGHQIAATAGLDAARGAAIVLMDADLQDPPELILEMLDQYRAGYDVVYAQRISREGEAVFKRFTAWLFYRLMRALVRADLPPDVGDYRLISRRFLDSLNQMRETHRFLRGMVTWVGFPQTAVRFARPARVAGKSKYPLRKMFKFAWTAIISFSPLPLRLSMIAGALIFSVGLTYAIYAVGRVLLGLYVVPGWTSVIILNSVGAGAILLAVGVLGEYVARIFEEIKGRPLYIVSERFNLAEEGPAPATASRSKRHSA